MKLPPPLAWSGFGGFWMGLEGPSFTIVRFFSWRPGQAHNGYIDVINELGYVGLALLAWVLVAHLWNIVMIHRRGEGLAAIFHLAVLIAALLLNVSETNFMRTTHLWWIILSSSIIGVHVHLHQLNRVSSRYRKEPKPWRQKVGFHSACLDRLGYWPAHAARWNWLMPPFEISPRAM